MPDPCAWEKISVESTVTHEKHVVKFLREVVTAPEKKGLRE